MPGCRVLVAALLSLLLFLSQAEYLAAQSTSYTSEELFRKTALSLGVPPDSKFYEVFKARVLEAIELQEDLMPEDIQRQKEQEYYDQTGEPAPYGPYEEARDKAFDPVVKHIRANFGIPFASEEYVKEHTKGFKEYFYNVLNREIEKDRPTEEEKKKNMETPRLPRCKKSGTLKFKSQYSDNKNPDQVIMDTLFMAADEIPVDSAEMFGLKTIIRPYRAGEPDPDSWAALAIGISCLPTRIRITPKFKFRHEGLDALRNYDNNPNGKGELHPLTALKFKELVQMAAAQEKN